MAPNDKTSSLQLANDELQRENRSLHARLDRDTSVYKHIIDERNAKVLQLTRENLELAYERDMAVDRASSSTIRTDALTKAFEDAKAQIATLSGEKLQSQLAIDNNYRLLRDGFHDVKNAREDLERRRRSLDRGVDSLDKANGAFETLLNERGITQSGPADGAQGASQALSLSRTSAPDSEEMLKKDQTTGGEILASSARPQSPISGISDFHAAAGGSGERNSLCPSGDRGEASVAQGKGTKRPASSEVTGSTDSPRPKRLRRSNRIPRNKLSRCIKSSSESSS
ncbi:MAG: hypothetical protein Q9208_008310 [Pyrenodesmia sp. 3 TL-2023]